MKKRVRRLVGSRQNQSALTKVIQQQRRENDDEPSGPDRRTAEMPHIGIQLSDSVLAGVGAFLFSTIVITAFGEILPQAYFSRNALRVTSALSPVFRIYQLLLYPIAKPVASLLDAWLGREGVAYFRERELRQLIKKHIEATDAEIERIEGLGALNFLAIDDVPVVEEGETINPKSIIQLPFVNGQPQFPNYRTGRSDTFLQAVQASGEKWVVFVDERDNPCIVMDADAFLREAFFAEAVPDPGRFCHKPIIVTDMAEKIGSLLSKWEVQSAYVGDNVVDRDLILFWNDTKKVITGADVLGRLLTGIVRQQHKAPHAIAR